MCYLFPNINLKGNLTSKQKKAELQTEEQKEAEDAKKNWYKKPFRKVWQYCFSQTASSCRQDAVEKYWELWRELECYINHYARKVEFPFSGLRYKSQSAVEKLISDFNKAYSGRVNDDNIEILGNLFLWARILTKQPLDKLNKAHDLIMMWRDIAYVRARLITDNILPNEKLSEELENCRKESKKICTEKNDGIEQLCHETALEIVENDSSGGEMNKKARRTIASIIGMLNEIRLEDIKTQLRIKKIYNVAFIFLSILSFFLLHLDDIMTDGYVPFWYAYHEFAGTFELSNPFTWIKAPFDFVVRMLHHNLLFFIFFGGLLGGFFSTVMLLRSKEIDVNDVYLRSYLLTKPIVGALGATILYIIITSDIIPIELGQMQLLDQFSKHGLVFGPLGFAFGFIMGFSERIILPTVKSEKGKEK